MGMQELWIESEGTRLFARDEGTGPPIVMLHGGMADHRGALPFVQPLVERHRIVTPDLRGSGRSWNAGALTFEQLTEDLARLLDHCDIDRAVIGGVSSGAGVALHFALAHPDRTRALIIATPMYAGSAAGLDCLQEQRFAELNAWAIRTLDEGIGALRPMYESLPRELRERALEMIEKFDPASVVTTSRFLASGQQPFADRKDLESVRMPTLLIRGNDPVHPAFVSELYATSIPDCHAVLARTGSAADAIEGFLASL